MQSTIGRTALLMLISASASPSSRRIEVAPLFWKGQDQPAFAVQCHNHSGAPRSRMEYVLKSAAFRLDGVLHERQEAMGSFVGPVDIAAGLAFNQLVVLGEGPRTTIDVAGDWTMTPWNLSLKPGQHRIAFRCWSDWSADYAFVWGGP